MLIANECPNCGSFQTSILFIEKESRLTGRRHTQQVGCSDCGLRGPETHKEGTLEAIRLWNKIPKMPTQAL